MKWLLKAVEEQCVQDVAITCDVAESLAKAAAELAYFTVVPERLLREPTVNQNSGLGRSRLNQLVTDPAAARDESMPQWERRFSSALRYLALAKGSCDAHAAKARLREVELIVSELARYKFEEVYDKENFVGEMTFNAASFLSRYIEYGILPVDTLATALAQDLRFQDILQPEQHTRVELYPALILSVCPPHLSPAAFLLDANSRPGLENADRVIMRTFGLLDAADTVAKRARRAATFASFLEATHVAHIIYAITTTSLRWILQRYEKKRGSPSPELVREEQISEENRCATGETLDSPWKVLALYPPAHLVGQILMTKRVPERDEVASFISDGIARIPVYPDILRNRWREIVRDMDLGRPRDHKSAFHRYFRVLCERGGLGAELAKCFRDLATAEAFRAVEMSWPRDKLIDKRMRELIRHDALV